MSRSGRQSGSGKMRGRPAAVQTPVRTKVARIARIGDIHTSARAIDDPVRLLYSNRTQRILNA